MTRTTWPTGQNYSIAVQAPAAAFGDPELKSGMIEPDMLGLPKPRSGNFAVVYKMGCGSRSWALKCFTREVADQQSRYAAISAHLQSMAIPYTVGFEYLPQGIRVDGQWFPMLKMEWVAGDSLITHVQARLKDSAALLALATRWVEMVRALARAGVAHGDLQHGNVLVVGGEFRLVDYDGMFVPSLGGVRGSEDGHPNYQHPARSAAHFGPALDNFSSWTVYVSLIALSIDPSLWIRFKVGDDCLLFRRSDFARPDSSPVFKALQASPDARLQVLSAVYRDLLRLAPDQVPSLDDSKHPIPPLTHSASSISGSWLDDHVKTVSPPPSQLSAASAPQGDSTVDAAWVLDFLKPATPPDNASFQRGVAMLRILLLASVAVVAGAAAILPGSLLPVAIALVLGLVDLSMMWGKYRREPGVESRRLARAGLREAERRLREGQKAVAAAEDRKSNRGAQRDRDVAAIELSIRTVEEKARAEVESVRRQLEKDCAQTQANRRRIDSDERDALMRIARGSGARVVDLRNQLAALGQVEASETTKALKTLQDGHVRHHLLSEKVHLATIPGVGPHLKNLLRQHGITSAQEVDRRKLLTIPGFGQTRVTSVAVWADGVRRRAQATMPKGLPSSDAQAIRVRHEGRRRTLTTALQTAEAQQRNEEQAVRPKYAPMRQDFDRSEAAPRAAAERDIREIEKRRDSNVQRLREDRARLLQDATRDLATLESTADADRKASLKLQWEAARATAQVKAYDSLKFGRYLHHVSLGFMKAA